MDDPEELSDDFEKRKEERAEGARERERKEKLRQQSTEVLKRIVKPALAPILESIQKRGHEAEIEEHFGSYPHVSLKLSPQRGWQSYARESVLRFSHTDSGKIEAKQNISTPQSSDSQHHYSPASDGPKETSEVSKEWVATHAISFIKAVLGK